MVIYSNEGKREKQGHYQAKVVKKLKKSKVDVRQNH